MNDELDLSPAQLDALKEIGNIGAGNSATALSQVINRRIDMNVPKVALVPLEAVPDLVGGPDAIVVGVFLRVYGKAPGNILFLLPKNSAFYLVDTLMGRPQGTTTKLDFMDESALMEIGNILDDGLAVQVGVVTRLTGPLREGGYGTAVANGFKAFGRGMVKTGQWMSGVGGKIFLGHGMKVNRNNSLHRWYVELLGGTQLRDGEHELGKLKLYEADFEMNLGMRLNSLLAVQVGAFGERLDLTQWSDHPEQVYGYRAELTFDPLRFVWHKAEEKGWAWIVGGGMEGGRVEMWNHVPGLNLERFIEPTMHTQLRRRLFGQTWLVLQGRWQMIDVDNDRLQMMAFAGVHQNLVGRKSSHRRTPTWWKGFWLAGSWGAWDMRNSLVRTSLGYDFNDVHSARLDYSYSHVDSHYILFFKKTYLNLFSLDYMMNVRNAFLGYEPKRRLNVYLFAGYNMAVHQGLGDESFWHAHTYVGMEGGAQLEVKILPWMSAFAEEKTMFLSGDPFLTNDFTQGFGMTGLVGLKVRF